MPLDLLPPDAWAQIPLLVNTRTPPRQTEAPSKPAQTVTQFPSAPRADSTTQKEVAQELARRRWEVACSKFEAAKKRENVPGKQEMSERTEITYQIEIAAAAWEMNGYSDGFNCPEVKSLRYRLLAFTIGEAQERLRKSEERYEHTIWTVRQAPEKEEARVQMEAARAFVEQREKERQYWRW